MSCVPLFQLDRRILRGLSIVRPYDRPPLKLVLVGALFGSLREASGLVRRPVFHGVSLGRFRLLDLLLLGNCMSVSRDWLRERACGVSPNTASFEMASAVAHPHFALMGTREQVRSVPCVGGQDVCGKLMSC